MTADVATAEIENVPGRVHVERRGTNNGRDPFV